MKNCPNLECDIPRVYYRSSPHLNDLARKEGSFNRHSNMSILPTRVAALLIFITAITEILTTMRYAPIW